MQKLIEAAEDLSKRLNVSFEDAMKILLMYQQNKILEKISEKLEQPTDILRYIN